MNEAASIQQLQRLTIEFNEEELDQFAATSRDHNPLHMDALYAHKTPFGQRVVFGALAVLKCFAHTRFAHQLNLKKLKVEFHHTIFLATPYAMLLCEESPEHGRIELKDGQRILLRLTYERQPFPLNFPGSSSYWQSNTRYTANDLLLKDLHTGEMHTGIYDLCNDGRSQNFQNTLYCGQINYQSEDLLVMLTSYLVGMEIPGKQALFSKLDLDFHQSMSPWSAVEYQLQLENKNADLGLLFLTLKVNDGASNLVASGSIQAFLRSNLAPAAHHEISNLLQLAGAQPLKGKTALVIGGSRGLGAEFVQALAICGADIYLNYARCDQEALALQQSFHNSIHLVKGSVNDPNFCAEVREKILAERGSLDILICNACSSPQPISADESSFIHTTGFINANLGLVTNPLDCFAEALQKSAGIFCAISSIYVETGSKDFPHYVALKTVMENLVKSASARYKKINFLVARPPKLLTDMSNTPVGSIGAIAPESVAVTIVHEILAVSGESSKDITLSDNAPNNNVCNYKIINDFERSSSGLGHEASNHSDINDEEGEASDTSPISDTHTDGKLTCIAASFSIDLLLPSMNFWSKELGLGLACQVTPYNQLFQELLSPQSQFNSNSVGVNLIFLRFEDWLPYQTKNNSGGGEATQAVELNNTELGGTWVNNVELEYIQENASLLRKTCDEFFSAINFYFSNNATPLEIFICPSLEISDSHAELMPVFTELESEFIKKSAAFDKLKLTIASQFHAQYGVTQYRDSLRCDMGHIPYTDSYFHTLGTLACRRLFSYQIAPYKVIVLDCDNTLWKGVCDEVGPREVKINEDFSRFQSFLIEQHDQGVLLCLCSKNREEAVWDVFEQHPDMLLKRTHLIDHCINWEAKSANIKSLAERLNLGLDSFIFIDDNPVECAEVRSSVPEVLTLQMPQETDKIRALINHLWVLDKGRITQEDKHRTRLYQEDKARKTLQDKTLNFQDFIVSLELKLQIAAVDESNISRIAQLTKRTNQFNLSSHRRSESDITALMNSGYTALSISVTDRFGDYGIVGFVLAEPQVSEQGSHLNVDTFLLSCRVLGRGVEHQIVAALVKLARSLHSQRLVFPFIRSTKNEPMLKFLLGAAQQLNLAQPISVEEGFEFIFTTDQLARLEFNPDVSADFGSESNPGSQNKHAEKITGQQSNQVDKAATSRYLQQALEKKIFIYCSDQSLSSQISVASTSNLTLAGNKTNTPKPIPTDSDATIVIDIFSKILGIDNSQISLDQDLETLVNESYKIVDLTVALKAAFPAIHQTLLFEANNIRQIVHAVAGEKIGQENFSTALNHPQKFKPIIGPFANNHSPNEQQPSLQDEDIAIIGMNGIFPGANTIAEFWENLKAGVCSIGDIPQDRWDIDQFYSADADRTDTSYCKKGGFINNPFNFDNQFFGISPREAETMDPQQRLFLQTVWGTLEDAGYTRASLPRSTGVFLGVISSDYALNAYQAALQGWSHYRMSDFYQIPNRVSYYFDLHGPSLAIDSACSSSASALHLACNSLRSGECASAIVGGVNLITHPSRLIQYSQMQMISKSGVCSPFSDAADGTLFGEGVCALMLKPLTKALQDGDNIHGVIKSTSINSGGKTNGFTVPSPRAHAELIGKALVEKNISPRSISYIEAHGTATNLGDPIEIRGLTEGFNSADKIIGLEKQDTLDHDETNRWCAIGSVKSNIGHLESCAAMAGIIKCLLQMKYRTLVPSLTRGHLQAADEQPVPPNAKINFEETPFKLQYQCSEWNSQSFPRRAGISSFGAGGANAHVIVEEAPEIFRPPMADIEHDSLVILSAPSENQLRSLAQRLLAYMDAQENIHLDYVCYTLLVGREDFDNRLALVCRSVAELASQLSNWLAGKNDPKVYYQFNLKNANPRAIEHQSPVNFPGILSGDSNFPATAELLNLAKDWVAGATVNFAWLSRGGGHKISLPGLEFGGKDHRIPRAYSGANLPAVDKLKMDTDFKAINRFIGTAIESPFIKESIFSTHFDPTNLPYLVDHRIYEAIVVPGSMYVSYVLTLARQIWSSTSHHIENVTFVRALMPEASQPVQISVQAEDEQGQRQISIVSRSNNELGWDENFQCVYNTRRQSSQFLPGAGDISGILSRMTTRMAAPADIQKFYQESIDIGFRWGPTFQCVRELHRRDGEALGLITLVDALMDEQDQYAIHPAFLDACFQVFVPGMASTGLQKEARQAYLPLGVNEIHFYRPVPRSVWSHVITRDDVSKDSLTIDIFLYTEDGLPVAFFKQMQVLRTSKSALMALVSKGQKNDFEYTLNWVTRDSPEWEEEKSLQKHAQDYSSSSTGKKLFCTGFNHSKIYSECSLLKTADMAVYDGTAGLLDVLATGTDVYLLFNLHSIAPTAHCPAETLTANILKNIDAIRQLIIRLENSAHLGKVKLFFLAQPHPQNNVYLENSFAALGRVIALEYPDYWGAMIEMENEADTEEKSEAGDGIHAKQWHRLFNLFDVDSEDHYRIGSSLQVPRLQKSPISVSTHLNLDPTGTYLVTGAFGSLGQHLVQHLVAEGAKNLLLLSRNTISEKNQAFVQQLTLQGVNIHCEAVDLSNYDNLHRALQSHLPRIRGIVHLAGILEDGALSGLSREAFQRVLAPKLAGTWNLHRLTERISVDFFALFSSASAILGAAGQANYALANGFLDAFAHYRRRLGLPAISINWGPWSGAGMAAEQDTKRKTWTNESFGSLDPNQSLKIFSNILIDTAKGLSGSEQYAVLPYNWIDLFKHYPVARIPSLLKDLAIQEHRRHTPAPVEESHGATLALLNPDVSRIELKHLTSEYLRDQVRKNLGFSLTDSIDGDRSFLALGFDSLMAVSFRTALAKALKFYLPATLIFDFPTLNLLSEHIVKQLLEKRRDETRSDENKSPPEMVETINAKNFDQPAEKHTPAWNFPDLEDISTLTDDELQKILESELDDIERILEA